eukprot:11802166-Prorocentrum_lima.AAC.1
MSLPKNGAAIQPPFVVGHKVLLVDADDLEVQIPRKGSAGGQILPTSLPLRKLRADLADWYVEELYEGRQLLVLPYCPSSREHAILP